MVVLFVETDLRSQSLTIVEDKPGVEGAGLILHRYRCPLKKKEGGSVFGVKCNEAPIFGGFCTQWPPI
jgi:hypothetical protein